LRQKYIPDDKNFYAEFIHFVYTLYQERNKNAWWLKICFDRPRKLFQIRKSKFV